MLPRAPPPSRSRSPAASDASHTLPDTCRTAARCFANFRRWLFERPLFAPSPECFSPLAPFLSRLAASGELTARHLYNTKAVGAWVAHGFTDAWAVAAPLASPMWSFCTSCGGWATLQLWQRYEFSRELTHLREVWPLLRGSALFYAERLLHRPARDTLQRQLTPA